jgi:hypothetical protein
MNLTERERLALLALPQDTDHVALASAFEKLQAPPSREEMERMRRHAVGDTTVETVVPKAP